MTRAIAALLVGISTSVMADDSPTGQWKMTQQSLSDLVEAGYSIVAVTNDSSGGTPMDTFFLQKGTSAYKCIELHANDFKSGTIAAMFNCWVLVKPYAVTHHK